MSHCFEFGHTLLCYLCQVYTMAKIVLSKSVLKFAKYFFCSLNCTSLEQSSPYCKRAFKYDLDVQQPPLEYQELTRVLEAGRVG